MPIRTSIRCVAVLFVSVLHPLSCCAYGNETLLTLEAAKKIAVERNIGLNAKMEAIEAAKALRGRAQAPLYPSVSTKFGSEQTSNSGANDSSAFGYLLATWNIYRGGRDLVALKTADLENKKAEVNYELEKLSVESAVEETFFNILYLRDLEEIKRRFIEINHEQQSFAKQIAARGGGSESDVVEFDLKASILESDSAQLQEDEKRYVLKLKSLLSDDVANTPSPTGELPHLHLNGNFQDYVNPNLSDTPKIKLSTLDLDVATTVSTGVKGRWLPQVDLEGRVGALPLSDGGQKGKMSSSLLLVATWEIFSGFDAAYENRERLAEKSQRDLQLQNDIRSLVIDAESLYGELITLQKRADLEKNNIRTAKRYYDLVSADFKRGYKNSTDFSASAQSWYEAEVARKNRDFEFIQKKLALELKIGKRIAAQPMKDVDNVNDKGGKHGP